MKVVLYMRCSTERQAEAKSIELQADILEKYCNYHNYQIIGRYVDEARSGKDIRERPGFQRLMHDAEQKMFDAVAVSKLDRFGRSVKDLENSIDYLKKQGINFISTGDNIDTTTANGRLFFHLLSAFAEYEREIIRERMEIGKERARKEGKLLHRPRKELPVEKIRDYYVNNNMSLCSLARLYHVHTSTIRSRLEALGVDIRKK